MTWGAATSGKSKENESGGCVPDAGLTDQGVSAMCSMNDPRQVSMKARRSTRFGVSGECLEPRLVLNAPLIPLTPVLFIPGFAASRPEASDLKNFVLHRGTSPAPLKLSVSYAPLVRAFEANGYVVGQTFFGATFDWRMPVAPTAGATPGNLTSLTAEQMTAGVRTGEFPYAVDYLGYWLNQVVQTYIQEKLPPPRLVDVITHSTGGSLARSYIESPAYGGTYIDQNGLVQTLPTIRHLVLGADPVDGTVHSWRPWNGDFQDVLSGFIPTTEISARLTALAYEYVMHGGTVTGPGSDGSPNGGDITRADIMEPDKAGELRLDPTTFFRLYTPLRQDLMPTFDFLVTPDTSAPSNVNDDPDERSDLELILNGGSTPGNVPWTNKIIAGGGTVTVTFAPGARETTQGVLYDFKHEGAVDANSFVDTPYEIVQTLARRAKMLPLPSLLYPQPQNHLESVGRYPFYALGDNELSGPLEGDNQVPFVSGIGNYESLNGQYVDPNVSIVLWGNGSPNGLALPYGPIERWTMESGYPLMHDYFFANPNVDSFVITTVSGIQSPVVPRFF
jgi:hypothetical protein